MKQSLQQQNRIILHEAEGNMLREYVKWTFTPERDKLLLNPFQIDTYEAALKSWIKRSWKIYKLK